MHPLWEETKSQYKGTPHERSTHFVEHAEAHPHEAARSLQTSSDARLEDLIHEYESRRADALLASARAAKEQAAAVKKADFDPDQSRSL
jgi:ABC-type nitrate/sulfonate/bicarbonate transport system substrate-binding protein